MYIFSDVLVLLRMSNLLVIGPKNSLGNFTLKIQISYENFTCKLVARRQITSAAPRARRQL